MRLEQLLGVERPTKAASGEARSSFANAWMAALEKELLAGLQSDVGPAGGAKAPARPAPAPTAPSPSSAQMGRSNATQGAASRVEPAPVASVPLRAIGIGSRDTDLTGAGRVQTPQAYAAHITASYSATPGHDLGTPAQRLLPDSTARPAPATADEPGTTAPGTQNVRQAAPRTGAAKASIETAAAVPQRGAETLAGRTPPSPGGTTSPVSPMPAARIALEAQAASEPISAPSPAPEASAPNPIAPTGMAPTGMMTATPPAADANEPASANVPPRSAEPEVERTQPSAPATLTNVQITQADDGLHIWVRDAGGQLDAADLERLLLQADVAARPEGQSIVSLRVNGQAWWERAKTGASRTEPSSSEDTPADRTTTHHNAGGPDRGN